MSQTIPLDENLRPYLTAASERKTQTITALDVRKLTSYADSLIIIDALSPRRVTAIAEHLLLRMKELGRPAGGAEGVKEGEWALLDFGDVIVHVFESKIKSYFNLEGLWADAPRFDLSEFEHRSEEMTHEDE